MEESKMKSRLILFATIIFAFSSVTAISLAQRTRDSGDNPIRGDFRITIKTTMAGQAGQTTTMIKGLRERDENNMAMGGMSMNQFNITQCDLKCTNTVNDRTWKNMITPMESDDSSRGRGGAMSA